MNEQALAQYRKNKRRFAKIRQGGLPPRRRHLSQRFGFSDRPAFRVMPRPAAISPLEFAQDFVMGLIGAMPFLKRREKQWRK